jgi:tRNA (cytidine/uridine-2'-O-)-methyltransferase
MFNVVLISPQIPPNTGNIGRLCVNTSSKLHLIEPLGFEIDDKAVKRAGLDYWHKLKPTVWKSWEDFLKANFSKRDRFFFATTKSKKPYFESNFQEGDFLFFGSETTGIDENILREYRDQTLTIPMVEDGRSLNLSISVSIILYKAIEQNFSNFRWNRWE